MGAHTLPSPTLQYGRINKSATPSVNLRELTHPGPTFSGMVPKEHYIMQLVAVGSTLLLTLVGIIALFIQWMVCFVLFHKNWR